VRASGKTPAGQHVPILLKEIMEILAPQPGERAVDCTLGYGGHASALLKAVQPGGRCSRSIKTPSRSCAPRRGCEPEAARSQRSS
jgi:16S rRNA C1402 N4-methylase RsmH